VNGVVQRHVEVASVERERAALNIRTPSIERAVSTLSGGNQQKVALARSLLAKPSLVLVDEPTQGVDAGARLEIYRILREVADSGVPVVVVSSDALELAGLCDRVIIFSRGQVVRELDADEVNEKNITQAIVTATTHRKGDTDKAPSGGGGWRLRVRQFARGDFSPSLVLVLVIAALGIYTYSVNERVLSAFNIGSALTLLTALALMSVGQLVVIFTGGIDISVGPLAGLLVVVASFFVLDGKSDLVIASGFLLMLAAALTVGLVNGALVRFGRFTPVAATLAMFIALQGVSLLLRPEPGGAINSSVSDAIQTRVGAVPIAFIVVVALVIALEYLLRYSRWGLALRAAGSQGQAAHRLGVPISVTIVGAYVLGSFFVFLGAIMLAAQIRIGDPVAGIEFTLASITAVVLGGASLFGGRGSVVGTFLGAALIQQILNATVFLRLSQAWQFWFLGMLTLIAAAVYSQARRFGQRA
jgi:ribose transport system ATP-binding protein